MSTMVRMGAGKPNGATPSVVSATRGVAMEGRIPGRRGSIVDVKHASSAQHWDSARDLVGSEPPTSDDVPTTLSGEPLDSADKAREFLATLERARTA